MSKYSIELFCRKCKEKTLHIHEDGVYTCSKCGRKKDLGDVLRGIDEEAVRKKCKIWKEFEGGNYENLS